jgi:hypothetical protein
VKTELHGIAPCQMDDGRSSNIIKNEPVKMTVISMVGHLFQLRLWQLWFERKKIWAYAMLLCAVLAGVAAYFDVKANYKGRAFDETVYMAAELAHEAGPLFSDYTNAIALYKELLTTHSNNLKARNNRKEYSKFYGDCSLNSSLKAALDTLSTNRPATALEASNVVRNAAVDLANYVSKVNFSLSEGFYARRSMLTKTTAKNNEIALEAIHELHRIVARLSASAGPSLSELKELCLATRKAGAYLEMVWPELRKDDDWQATIHQFKRDLSVAKALVDNSSSEPDFRILQTYSRSIGRRISAVNRFTEANFAEIRGYLIRESTVE